MEPSTPSQQSTKPNWEQETIERIALAGIKEQKRSRRWNIFFKFLFFIYVTFIIVSLSMKSGTKPHYDLFGQDTKSMAEGHIALIRLSGVISAAEHANAELMNSTLRRALSNKNVKGVLLLANSPGGSPVQSSLIYETIKTLKEQYNKPIYTAVTDVCASGCYYVASATDEIYADHSSIVGSIGVISQSFGYGDAAKKLGIDLRTFTAGKNKDFLSPARPLRPDEIEFMQSLLDDLHQNFISAVKAGRGDRLADDKRIFSGLFWVGEKAQKLGLVDGFATPVEVAKKIGNYPIYDYMAQDPIERVLGKFGVQAENAIGEGINKALAPSTELKFQ
ncbi:MAG: signal peptide peptidase SppA [Gammaproteobacteria bacterium]|nr:signal peptide peptidase SppA [Gammaproteobacteria bacterium]